MTKKNGHLGLLVADDHELVRRGVREILQSQRGFRVIGEAADGREAVEKAKVLKPAVAIIDIEMPGLDGLEATREICKTVPGTHVLILTMHGSEEMVRQVLEAGARGFVLKSDLAQRLLRVTKAVSRGEFSFTPKVSEILVHGFLNIGKESAPGSAAQAAPTARETEVIRLLAEGRASKEVAAVLGISVKTVDTYRARIMLKLNINSISGLVLYAVRHKLIEA